MTCSKLIVNLQITLKSGEISHWIDPTILSVMWALRGWGQGKSPLPHPYRRPPPPGFQRLWSFLSQPLHFQNKGVHFDLSLDGTPAPTSLIIFDVLLLTSSSFFMSFKGVPRTAHNISRDQRIILLSLPIDVKKCDHDKMNHFKEFVLESKPKVIHSFLYLLTELLSKKLGQSYHLPRFVVGLLGY